MLAKGEKGILYNAQYVYLFYNNIIENNLDKKCCFGMSHFGIVNW